MKKKWYRPFLYYLARGFHKCIIYVPRPIILALARFIARCAFYFIPKQRQKAITNLTQVFQETKSRKEIFTIARSVFENLALTACDFALFPRLTPQRMDALVTVYGIEKLDALLARNERGCIIVTAHIGNWELMAASLIDKGYKGFVLGKRIYYEAYNNLIVSLRESKGVETYYRDQSPKEILKRLKKGIILGILPDQDIQDVEGIFVDFFGKPAYTPTGPAKIAISAKVPIILVFMIREGTRYALHFEMTIEPEIGPKESKNDAIRRITELWNSEIERYIRLYPEQWAWIHNRWKTKKDEIATI